MLAFVRLQVKGERLIAAAADGDWWEIFYSDNALMLIENETAPADNPTEEPGPDADFQAQWRWRQRWTQEGHDEMAARHSFMKTSRYDLVCRLAVANMVEGGMREQEGTYYVTEEAMNELFLSGSATLDLGSGSSSRDWMNALVYNDNADDGIVAGSDEHVLALNTAVPFAPASHFPRYPRAAAAARAATALAAAELLGESLVPSLQVLPLELGADWRTQYPQKKKKKKGTASSGAVDTWEVKEDLIDALFTFADDAGSDKAYDLAFMFEDDADADADADASED